MSKRVADKLRGHARLLVGVVKRLRIHHLNPEWKNEAITVLDGVIRNLRTDANLEEQRGKDYAKDQLRPYRVAREREVAKLGIEEQERKKMPPRQEPPL